MIDDQKEECLVEIFNSYNELYYKEKNIVKGIVFGLEIDEVKLSKLEKTFSNRLKISLSFKLSINCL